MKPLKGFDLVLGIATILSVATVLTDGCSHEEIQICYPKIKENGTEKCVCFRCPDCPHGQGLSVECGSRVTNGTPIECRKCVEGVTYSDVHFPQKCKPCNLCENKVTLQECTLESNRVCSEKECEKGFYYKWTTETCEKCSPCCVGKNYTRYNSYPKECRDMSEGQNCERTMKTCPHKRSATTTQPIPGSTTQRNTPNSPLTHVPTSIPNLPAVTPSRSSESVNISKPSKGFSEENKETKAPHLSVVLVIVLLVCLVCCLLSVLVLLLFCINKRRKTANSPSNNSSTTSLPDENEKCLDGNHKMEQLGKTQCVLVDEPGAVKKVNKGPQSSRGEYVSLNLSYCDSDNEQMDTRELQGKNQERKPVLHTQDLERMLSHIPHGHLLKDLSSEVFEKVETKLNNRTLGINGWRKVGEGMDVSMDHLDTFELEYQKIGGSPARALFNYITARSPDELTRTFVELLCQKDRNDIAKIICEWDWPSKTGAAVDCNQ